MKREKLVLVSEHFEPSTGATGQLMTDLARGLHGQGWKIRVVTATPGKACGFNEVRLCVSRSRKYFDKSISRKAVKGIEFLICSFIWILLRTSKDEIVIIVSNPPFIGLLGIALLIIRRQPYVFIFQDLFPHSAILSGLLPSKGWLTFLWWSLMKEICQRSEAIVVLSEAMEARVRCDFKSELNLHVIPNWAVEQGLDIPRANNRFAIEHGFAERFTLQYSGNFGRMHELLTILEAARLMKDEEIQFLFIGAGEKLSEITSYLQNHKLNNLLHLPYQPRHRLKESLAACDMSAIGLVPGAEDTVAPCKFYGILASGRGVVLVARRKCDLAQLVIQEQCGIVVEPGEGQELADILCQLAKRPDIVKDFGDRGRDLYQRKFGFKRSLRAYSDLIESLGRKN